MKFSVNQQDLQKSLGYCQGVIEKRSTLPILSNILLDISNTKLTITATDLDLIFIHQIKNVEVLEEGKITTSSSIMYDIVRKFSSGKKINLNLNDTSKLHLESEKSVFNLNCISAAEFPVTDENFNENEFSIKSKQLLKLLNKCKFSISNDETRHYLSGIYLHQTEVEDKTYLTAVATDSHRMSIAKIRLEELLDSDSLRERYSKKALNRFEKGKWGTAINQFNNMFKETAQNLPMLKNDTDTYKKVLDFIHKKKSVTKADILNMLNWGVRISFSGYRNRLRNEPTIRFTKDRYEVR